MQETLMRIQPLRHIMCLILVVLATSCSQKSDVDNATGSVKVDVPVQKNSDSFIFKTVELFGIDSLKKVSGAFVNFFYSPGARGTQVVGDSPTARFVKVGDRFIPMDAITNQMAVIYYHLQNMAQLDDLVGAKGVNRWPRSVGLDTVLSNVSEQSQKNNAFYDGYTDSMMFLPYTADQLPISTNGGIIAHEHFHSLYYKIVIKKALENKNLKLFSRKSMTSAHQLKSSQESIVFRGEKMILPETSLSNSEQISLANRVYLMGLNEGLADFWAWVYSDDANYIRWSLPSEKTNRSLELKPYEEGQYQTNPMISRYIGNLFSIYSNPDDYISGYIYLVGTPYARFLRQLTMLVAEQQSKSVSDVKIQIAKKVVKFLYSLAAQVSGAQPEQVFKTDDLFSFLGNDLDLKNTKACDFILKYTTQVTCQATVDKP